VCRGCRFVNEGHDKFCGGCGSSLDDRVQATAPPPIEQPPVRVRREIRPLSISFDMPSASAPSTPAASMSESDELFAPVAVTPDDGLPSAGITQSDLDRLFGVGS
jgi:hypothetical protein